MPDIQKYLLEYFKQQYPVKKRLTVSNLAKLASPTSWETELYSFTLEYEKQDTAYTNDLIFRLYPQNTTQKAAKEYNVMTKLYEVGYPVPKVYHLETNHPHFGSPFIIMERIHGKTLGAIFDTQKSERKTMIKLLCKLLVDLHGLDVKSFLLTPDVDSTNALLDYRSISLLDYMTLLLDNLQQMIVPSQQARFKPIMDWLEQNKRRISTTYISLIHFDFHAYNILIRDEDKAPFVIDWPNCEIADSRLDLAWTLLLHSTYNNPEMRDVILDNYETIAGRRVENIEYFEVIAAMRRLYTIALSLSEGAEKLGMRRDAIEMMRQQKEHIKAIIRVIQDRTGMLFRGFDELFNP